MSPRMITSSLPVGRIPLAATITRVGTITCSIALSTSARVGQRRSAKRVFWRELVPLLAMCFHSIFSCWPFAAQSVNLRRNGLKVDGINTGANATQVIRLESVRDNTNEHFITGTRGSNAIGATKISVTIPVKPCSPQPAGNVFERYVRVYLDFAEKAGEKFAIYWESVRIWFEHRCLLKGNGVGLA